MKVDMEGAIHKIARNYWHPGVDMDDLLQEGRLALLQAERNYRPEEGEFATFAYHYIRGYIHNYVVRKAPEPQLPTDEDGHEVDVEDYRNQHKVNLDMDKLLSGLPPLMEVVIRYRYGIGIERKTTAEVAELMPCSVAYVSKLHKQALEKLKFLVKKQ